MSVKVELDQKVLDAAHDLFANAREQVGRAAGVAINRTMVSLRKEASVTIRKHYTVKAATVKGAFNIKRATASSTHGALVAKGRTLDLGKFQVKPRQRGPVRVRVRKDSSLTPVKGLFVHPDLVPLMRRTPKAYPLRVPYGPSAPQMFGSEQSVEDLAPRAEEILNQRFLHEIIYRYNKIYGGK